MKCCQKLSEVPKVELALLYNTLRGKADTKGCGLGGQSKHIYSTAEYDKERADYAKERSQRNSVCRAAPLKLAQTLSTSIPATHSGKGVLCGRRQNRSLPGLKY